MGKEKVSNYDLQVDIGKRLFLDHDQERLIRKFRLEADREWIYLTYLNTPCRLSRATGAVEELRAGQWRAHTHYEPHHHPVMLHPLHFYILHPSRLLSHFLEHDNL